MMPHGQDLLAVSLVRSDRWGWVAVGDHGGPHPGDTGAGRPSVRVFRRQWHNDSEGPPPPVGQASVMTTAQECFATTWHQRFVRWASRAAAKSTRFPMRTAGRSWAFSDRNSAIGTTCASPINVTVADKAT